MLKELKKNLNPLEFYRKQLAVGYNMAFKWTKSVFRWISTNLAVLTMANRVSNEQLEELLEFLAEHPSLAKGIGLGARSKETIDKQWNDLAMKLNSFGSGCSKTGERWRKYWADIKHKAKSRLTKRRQDALGTGGGPSNQEDLSEIDKKILTIIGEQAVYGDTEHRAPVFNTQPEEVCVPVQTEDIVVSEAFDLDTSEFPMQQASLIETQQTPEPPQTGIENPVSHSARKRPRLRHNRPSITATTSQTRIDPEWVMELERSRVEAETKMANATLIMAEAANKIAEASRINAETSRQQVEALNAIVAVVGQLSSVLAARHS